MNKWPVKNEAMCPVARVPNTQYTMHNVLHTGYVRNVQCKIMIFPKWSSLTKFTTTHLYVFDAQMHLTEGLYRALSMNKISEKLNRHRSFCIRWFVAHVECRF